ncbi:outer membrane protein assembly factor BamE domain-containing protein [Buttiauxella massiliensis]|uniref:outer membrane protein assembly factor BamE domain-containing protein n=1 Tax=Buttiauxella massiliensis TaxID=2831590 RepID=UPI00125FE9E8|nr:outer membrane protein assembly factor BamE [Buttiauxella massiliensis]
MKYLMIALLSLLLTACTTGEKIGDLSPGMSREQVIKTLGKPDGDAVNGKNELLTYSNRLMSGWGYDRADYKVVLEDNKVVQYGADVIRQDNGAAAARALTAQQSLLIWQQQQALQQPRSTTTNCSQFGNNVTGNSY